MTSSPAERRIRASLIFVRLLQQALPLSASRWLLRLSLARARRKIALLRPVSAGGVPCDWVIPPGSSPHRALIYFHGGGFVLGQTPLHLQMAADWAGRMNLRILMVDYRLAPEFPFPAALDDCVSAYRWLLQQGFSVSNLVMAGDSAGGNLTVAALMKLRDSGDPLPAAAACLSPAADLSAEKPQIHFKDPLLPPKATRLYRTSYLGSSDPHNPLISPVLGDWRGLPPMLIHVGEDEILREDAVLMEKAAKAAGVDVRLEIYPRMWHVWQIYRSLPQARQSLDDIAQFFQSHLDISFVKLESPV